MDTQPPLTDDEIWSDDRLGRRSEATLLFEFLIKRTEERALAGQAGSYVLNIDSGWGRGKTFFLTRLKQHIEKSGYVVCYVNAWEDDCADDPLISILSAMEDVIEKNYVATDKFRKAFGFLKEHGTRLAVVMSKNIFKRTAERVFGEKGMEEISKEMGGFPLDSAMDFAQGSLDRFLQQQLDDFKRAKSTMDRFRDAFREIVQAGDGKPIFFLVDELDRCRPPYAINFLERTKHLFNVTGAIFVFATDVQQLSAAVGAVYGEKFNGIAYFRRFFDRTYRFASPRPIAIVEEQFVVQGIDEGRLIGLPEISKYELISCIFEMFRLTIRDIVQCMDILCNFVTLWRYDFPIQILHVVPLIVAHQQGDSELFDRFENCSSDINVFISQNFLLQNWHYKFQAQDQHRSIVNHNYMLPDIYRAFYVFASSPLRDAMNLSPNGLNGILAHMFKTEFVKTRGAEFSELGGYSAIRLYPKMILGAGRFSQS